MATGTDKRSRRAVLAGLGGGVAALVAQAIGRPLPAQADGETVKVGHVRANAMSPTVIRNRINDEDVFVARSDGDGAAITGASARSTGVFAQGGSVGLLARGGFAGVSGDGEGLGLFGSSDFGTGVTGLGHSRAGVHGISDGGIGVLAESSAGFALTAEGRVTFPRISGVAVVPPGETSHIVAQPGSFVAPGAFVLLTPRRNLDGRDLWYKTDPEANTFTIHLSEPRTNPTPVAWLLVG
jgi:hypothetical protein